MEYEILDTRVKGDHKHTEYKFEGISILQHPNITKYFPKIINDFDRIIELGTYFGALTLYLYRIKKPETELISYDIDVNINQVPKQYGIDTRWGDYYLESTINEIKDLIENPSKRVLLLCDGGYKEYEFSKYSQYLKPNDVIMVHDYQESVQEYERITHAIDWYDIADSGWYAIKRDVEKNDLSKHQLYNEFKSVLWGIFIKNNNYGR